MKDYKMAIGYIVLGMALLYELLVVWKTMNTPGVGLMSMIGGSIQPTFLLVISLLFFRCSKTSNYMNRPENTVKWIIISLIVIYVCTFCVIGILAAIYSPISGPPNVFSSSIYYLIFASVIVAIIYFKNTIQNRVLRWAITLLSILAFFFSLFLAFVFVFALPDQSSQPILSVMVLAISLSIMIFQSVRIMKSRS